MKVYYEMPELFDEDLPNELQSKFNKLSNECLFHTGHKFKYRIMWELRHLEKEINDEGGAVIIKSGGGIEAKDFSDELLLKIGESINQIDLKVW